MKKNLLVTLADENHINQAKQLFSSVYFNAGWKGDYMLLAHEIPEKELKWFRKKGILIKKCRPITKTTKIKTGKWPLTVFSKFYLFTPYFKRWKNIVFLDADIIVRASLDDLAKIKGFAAIKSHDRLSKLFLKPFHIRLEKIDKNKLKDLKNKYDFNAVCFNSGIMAFSTDVIKKDMFDKLKGFFESYAEISAGAEEAMFNLLFYKKWIQLSEAYNIHPDNISYLCNIPYKKIKGIILHFIINKPWNEESLFYKEWKSNLDKAELIDLKKVKAGKKWTKKEISDYLKYLRKRRKRFFYRKVILDIGESIDRQILGWSGIFLKNNHLKLYKSLKNLKEKIEKWLFKKSIQNMLRRV